MALMIQAENVRKTYRIGKVDVEALRGVSLGIEKSEFVSIVGPSGSGKSTLFYILGGLTHADSGRVIIDGVDFTALSDSERTKMRKRKIGFVFQKFNLLPTLSAQGNIDIARDIAGKSANHDQAHVDRITQLLGIDKRMLHRPSEMSGGEQQRVALAREQTSHRAGRRAHRQPRLEEFRNCTEHAAAVEQRIGANGLDDHSQPRGCGIWGSHHSHA